MATMKVSLPDAMLAWLEGQTRSGRYPNASEYVSASLVRSRKPRGKAAILTSLDKRRNYTLT